MSDSKAFYLGDYPKTLFPLKTGSVLVEHGADKIRAYIDSIFASPQSGSSFIIQAGAYAAKQSWHLRRTMKLDPVAEFYIYDLVYRNRLKFRPSFRPTRTCFGYRFKDGQPIPAGQSYKAFKGAISEYTNKYAHFMSFDISSYFNSLYHHDIIAWFEGKDHASEDSEKFGRFLREIAGGRSIDCLPQGLYATKMIGNDILSFIDNDCNLKSAQLIRFMDDFYIFDDDTNKLLHDFVFIQKLLGEKGLSINPKKTRMDQAEHADIDDEIDNIKIKLLNRRRYVIQNDYDDLEEIDFQEDLNDDELSYIDSILTRDSIEEEDVELVLSVMRSHTENVMNKLDYIIAYFPNLSKNIYYFCSNITNKEGLATVLIDYLSTSMTVIEYQLFWIGAILEEYLMDTQQAPALIEKLYFHSSATDLTKAKILEIQSSKYGLPNMRDLELRKGNSNWLSWAAAVGSLADPKSNRNYKLGYFKNGSQMNRLIYEILSPI